jgi:hypothetical protein
MGENILSQFGSRLGAYTEVALIPSDSLTSNSDILGHHRASLRQDFHAIGTNAHLHVPITCIKQENQ